MTLNKPKFLLTLFLAFSFIFFSHGQRNLIPNPSFEEFNFLVLHKSQNGQGFTKALPHWYSPSNFDGTPDFISPNIKWSIGLDKLEPNGTNNFAGIATGKSGSEYISVKLLEKLDTGKYATKLSC